MQKVTRVLTAILLTGLVLLTSAEALAQTGGYSLAWWTVDGGGAVVEAGSYRLAGTAGQPDAGLLESSGYRLIGGFWPGAMVTRQAFLPLVLRDGS